MSAHADVSPWVVVFAHAGATVFAANRYAACYSSDRSDLYYHPIPIPARRGIWLGGNPGAADEDDVRRQVSHKAVDAIQRKILSGEYQPGQSLPSQIDLAAQLGVSRASLREALSTLETLGFLSIEPGRGTFVSSSNPTQSGSLSVWRYSRRYEEGAVFQTRLALECAIVAQAAMQIGEVALDGLRRATQGMRDAWKAQDLVRVAECDKQFHEVIVMSCGNAMMNDIYFGAKDILQETQVHPLPITRSKRAEESISEHGRIIEALQAHDPVRAEAAMRHHIVRTGAAVGIDLADNKAKQAEKA
jgi:GntR family transcriptional repressor for pyruvate dehydrogenase complex